MLEYLCAECGCPCRPHYEDVSGVPFPEMPEFIGPVSSCCQAELMDDDKKILTPEQVQSDMESEAWIRQEHETDTWLNWQDVFGGKV